MTGVAIALATCGCATYSRPRGESSALAIVKNDVKIGFFNSRMVQVGHVDGLAVFGSGDIPLVPGEHALKLRYVEIPLMGDPIHGLKRCTVLLPAQANHRYTVHGETRPTAAVLLLLNRVEWAGWIEDRSNGACYECTFE